MNKFKIVVIIFILIISLLIIYPFINLDTGEAIYVFSYSTDIDKYVNNSCYDESYFYFEDKDISIYEFNYYRFNFFHMIKLNYKKGNICASEYLLEEDYINDFLDRAVINENVNNIDVSNLIEGKSAIVSNKKYFGNDYSNGIWYQLDGKEEVMYIFYVDDLLVIQVGYSDEGAKFIAYK